MYTVLWRFTVKPASRDVFERYYGADGSWEALFRNSPGYLGTALLRDTADGDVYVTIDRWVDVAAFDAFKAAHGAAYAALDRECEEFTLREERIGVIADPS